MACFTVYIIANIGLSLSPNFAVLLIFRGLQAAGSASTPSLGRVVIFTCVVEIRLIQHLGNGVIQDIAPSADRASFIGFYQASRFDPMQKSGAKIDTFWLVRNFSIAIGPVLGGIISDFLGFRAIFVFLLILSSVVVSAIIIFLPETMREIAGNGTLRQKGVYKPLIYKLTKEPSYWQDPKEPIRTKKITIQTFVAPLRLFTRKEILVNLIFGGVISAVGSMVTCSTTSLFQSNFQLNDTLLGLAFLPTGSCFHNNVTTIPQTGDQSSRSVR